MTIHSKLQSTAPNIIPEEIRMSICHHSKRITFLSILFASIATIFIWLFILYIILRPEFYSYIGFANNYVLKKPESINDPAFLQMIGTLVKNGTILSLDDFWSFQSTLYQTIITVLIALNGIIAAFSFFIIKSSSTAKAREEARNEAILEVSKYIASVTFENNIKDKLDQSVKTLQFDLKSLIDTVSEIKESDSSADIEKLNSECTELKRHIKIISRKISLLDNGDNNGSELVLKSED